MLLWLYLYLSMFLCVNIFKNISMLLCLSIYLYIYAPVSLSVFTLGSIFVSANHCRTHQRLSWECWLGLQGTLPHQWVSPNMRGNRVLCCNIICASIATFIKRVFLDWSRPKYKKKKPKVEAVRMGILLQSAQIYEEVWWWNRDIYSPIVQHSPIVITLIHIFT